MFKRYVKFLTLLVILLLVITGCGGASTTSSTNQNPPSSNTPLTIQDIAGKYKFTLGELNKMYRLDTKYKNADGTYMVVNFQSIKAIKQIKDFNNVIMIDNVLPIDQTREMIDKAGFFGLYDETGKEFSDIQVTTGRMDNGDSGILLYNDKADLTKYKYLSFGPIDGQNRQIVFPIQQ